MIQTLEERLKELLNKHLRHVCTPEEETELALLIAQSDDALLKKILFSDWENYESSEVLSEEKSKEIVANILFQPKRIQKYLFSTRRVLRYSAVAAIVLIALLVFFNKNESKNDRMVSNNTIQIALPSSREAVDYTRNISLPDGSSVILHKGSTLDYGDEFSKTSREVSLSGEAYFDVAQKPEQPFIIHSKTVKTIVLGTAFSVKAWPNQEHVIVTVTRGKVKVENNSEILAVLTANQQLDYDMQEPHVQTVLTQTEQDMNEWIKEDMTFDQVPLSRIVSVLEKRYKVNIHIREQSLGEKIIVSSFNGMETLSNVLDMLCLIMPEMSYETDNENNITINKSK
jgi:ferric-dicitrate binding protein FerR (iron transport regulator)